MSGVLGRRLNGYAGWIGGLGALLLSASLSYAQSVVPAAAATTAIATLHTVTVSGVQPGPGLWHADKQGHRIWILGTTSPLPPTLQWQSQAVATALAQSEVLLDPPAIQMKLDTGFFGKLWLLPTLIGVRNNPDGKTLREVVAPADYARWQTLKARYLADADKYERWRPIFAAYQLYHQALRAHGLNGAGTVIRQVRQWAASAHIARDSTAVTVRIEQPRQLVKRFKRSELEDAQCFAQTLNNLDTDMQTLTRRAQAWAIGDLAALRQAYAVDERVTCMDVISEAGFLKQAGLADLLQRQRQQWLNLTLQASQRHHAVFALLPMDVLLDPKAGYLAGLQAAGYQISTPDTDPDAAAAAAVPDTH